MAPKLRQEVELVGDREPDQITGCGADDDLDQRDRDGNADRDDGHEQRRPSQSADASQILPLI